MQIWTRIIVYNYIYCASFVERLRVKFGIDIFVLLWLIKITTLFSYSIVLLCSISQIIYSTFVYVITRGKTGYIPTNVIYEFRKINNNVSNGLRSLVNVPLATSTTGCSFKEIRRLAGRIDTLSVVSSYLDT